MSENIHDALFKLQGLLRGVKKDSKNPHFKNSYASLEQVTDTIRPHMQSLGLYWMQMPGKIVDGSIEVTTRICHLTGQSVEFTMEMPLAKRDPQGAGSSMTYAMRYSLMAALGLPPTDDDAETAIDRNNERPAVEVAPKSSASLKRANSWEELQNELAQDMVDVRSLPALERLKADYRKRASEQGWTKAWLNALADEFIFYENEIKKNDTVGDLVAMGGRVVNERHLSTLEAGE
jgi:hypothetical protein